MLGKFGKTSAVLAAAVVGSSLMTAPVSAQEEAGPNTGALSFGFGVDFTTVYVFRGYEQEDSELIAQPWVEIGTTLIETEDVTVDFAFGNWNSFHSAETGTDGSGPEWWYEADLYAGLSISFLESFVFDLGYTGYFYPGGAAEDIHELGFGLSYDDSALWEEYMGGGFALNPYVFVAVEVDNRNGDDEFAYLELGVEPSFLLVDSADYPLTLSIPVAVGLSLDDYYVDEDGDEETFGFVSVGAMLGTDLPFIPSAYGAWSLSGGVTVYFLNDEAGLNDGDTDDINISGIIGISASY